MTKSIWSPAVLLLLLAFVPSTAWSNDDLPPLPEDVVARVVGRDLTFDGLCKTAAQQKQHELMNPGSTVASALRQVMEERIIQQEAQRLGLSVTEQDVTNHLKTIDKQVRERSGGNTTIRDVMRQKNVTMNEMRNSIAHQLRLTAVAKHPSNLGDSMPKNDRERLSQLKVVLDKIVSRTTKHYYVATAFQKKPTAMDAGAKNWIASVQVHPSVPKSVITRAQFGRELVMRLSGSEVRAILDRECKTGLMASAGVSLKDEEFDAEVAYARKIWDIERKLSSQEAFSTVTYDNFIEAKHGLTPDEMKSKRYYRGHFGLLRRFRATVTEEQIRKEWEEGKETTWGPFILVTDVQIEFKQDNERFARKSVRHKKQAVKLAREVGRQLAAGMGLDQIVRGINSKKDPTFIARKRRLRPTDADFLLYKRAFVMKDGDLSSPIETISHMHVLKRERFYEAPTYAEVRPLVKEWIARREARKWIEEQVLDPKYVRIRWPLPQRGGLNPTK